LLLLPDSFHKSECSAGWFCLLALIHITYPVSRRAPLVFSSEFTFSHAQHQPWLFGRMRAFMERIQRPFPLLLMHDEITERMMMARTDARVWDGLPVA
jgi:hypothetical protein